MRIEEENTQEKETLQKMIKLLDEKIRDFAVPTTGENIYSKYLNNADVICTTLNSCYLMQKYIATVVKKKSDINY